MIRLPIILMSILYLKPLFLAKVSSSPPPYNDDVFSPFLSQLNMPFGTCVSRQAKARGWLFSCSWESWFWFLSHCWYALRNEEHKVELGDEFARLKSWFMILGKWHNSTPEEIWLAPLLAQRETVLRRGFCPSGTLVIYGRKTKWKRMVPLSKKWQVISARGKPSPLFVSCSM